MTNLPSDIRDAFHEAQKLQERGALLEAERIYRNIAAPGKHRRLGLEALSDMYIQSGRSNEAIGVMQELIADDPNNAHEHFNLAVMYQREQQFSSALTHYRKAIDLNISDAEEAYCNMGAIYSDLRNGVKATELYEKALAVAPDYIPALFNLASYHEELGERQKATELLQKIQEIDDSHFQSLARLAHLCQVTDSEDPLIARLNAALDRASSDAAREMLCFALAKVFDDLRRFEKASALFVAANEIGAHRRRAMDTSGVARAFDNIMQCFDESWIGRNALESSESPIFICGMYRSGSTLLEQMLAGHPEITAAGELNHLPLLIGRFLSPFPNRALTASRDELLRIATGYTAAITELFPGQDHVTDKRPDNFLHIGIIKALFPNARIIHTRRQPLDNCLSIYFQQLDPTINYAGDLRRIAHYRYQHDRLMDHWLRCFGDGIHTVDYEELVTDKEAVLARLLNYLGLPWNAQVGVVSSVGNAVKTASVWQVREKIHTRSVRRWKNYQQLASVLQHELSTFGPRYAEIKA